LLNIDIKTGDLADQVADVVIAAGMADQVVMKHDIASDADLRWAQARRFAGRIPFMPKMSVRPGRFAEDLARLAPLRPPMVEVVFQDLADLEAARAQLDALDIRVWVNTLDVFHCLDLNDSRALADPDAVWGRLVRAGVGAIQTDESERLVAYLGSQRWR
jgi:glycerophosphoryl diester phosphodiesterase